jgi:hypothetical protein
MATAEPSQLWLKGIKEGGSKSTESRPLSMLPMDTSARYSQDDMPFQEFSSAVASSLAFVMRARIASDILPKVVRKSVRAGQK